LVKQLFRYMAGREHPADRPTIAARSPIPIPTSFKELMVTHYRPNNFIYQEGCRWLTSLANTLVCLAVRYFVD
jgi:hypothetical protein